MQLLISDANILIDIEEGGLIQQLFQLPYEFSIPDVLFQEEMEEQHSQLLDYGLQLGELSGETMLYAMEIIPRYQRASRNDCFALALAKQEDCLLLTGDKALRIAAEKEAVIVKGTIWLISQMVRHQLIEINVARQAYILMQSAGRRLPWDMAEQSLIEHEKEIPQ